MMKTKSKKELVKGEFDKSFTKFEISLLDRLDSLVEVLCDIRNVMDGGRDGR